MRLWSLHPKYLDARGLAAVWREALLAQAVLRGQTRGYTRHPQLERFQRQSSPVASIGAYLRAVWMEASRRGYRFDVRKIFRAGRANRISVTRGQMAFEWTHLRKKLVLRDPGWLEKLRAVKRPQPNPIFRIVPGNVEPWEKQPSDA